MATAVNNPGADTSNNAMGMVLGLILLLLIAFLFFAYGLPSLSNQSATPQVNVPGKVDVNVKGTK
jgi:hypothetical protein